MAPFNAHITKTTASAIVVILTEGGVTPVAFILRHYVAGCSHAEPTKHDGVGVRPPTVVDHSLNLQSGDDVPSTTSTSTVCKQHMDATSHHHKTATHAHVDSSTRTYMYIRRRRRSERVIFHTKVKIISEFRDANRVFITKAKYKQFASMRKCSADDQFRSQNLHFLIFFDHARRIKPNLPGRSLVSTKVGYFYKLLVCIFLGFTIEMPKYKIPSAALILPSRYS